MTHSEIDGIVAKLAVESLQRRGLTMALRRDDEGYQLIDEENSQRIFLTNITGVARDTDPDEWPKIVDDFIGAYLSTANNPPLQNVSESDIRQQIRTRVLAAANANSDQVDLSYARKFAPDLIVALCMDYPQTVNTLPATQVEKISLPLDELYVQGQANTDAEPIDEKFHVQDDIWALSGDSFFVASRVLNFKSLLPIIGPAPHGVAFAVLNRSLLFYVVLEPSRDSQAQVVSLVQAASKMAFNSDITHPGGLISANVYFWAPDGTVDRLSHSEVNDKGEAVVQVILGENFVRYNE